MDSLETQPLFVRILIARADKHETFYKKVEAMSQPPEMTDEQLAEMNTALKLVKDKNYRPYCVADKCKEMPRMILTNFGFRCWACGNEIVFNLQRR